MKIKSENLKDTYERHDPIREHNSHRKTFEELNLMDSFLFESATEKPENAVLLSKVIIERTLGRKVQNLVVQPQKFTILSLTITVTIFPNGTVTTSL